MNAVPKKKYYEQCCSRPPTSESIGYQLSIAVSRGDLAKVQTLLAIGVHVDQPSHIIQLLDHLSTFDLLKRFHECEYDYVARPDEWLLTPLHIAIINGDKAMVELLLGRMANVNITTYGNVSPLILAILLDRYEIAEQLVKAGADPNIRTVLDRTALFYAVQAGNHDMVKILCKAGAKAHIYDIEYTSPLFLAIDLEFDDIVMTLIGQEDEEDDRYNVLYYVTLEKQAYDLLSRLVESDAYAELLTKDKLSLQSLLFCANDEGKKKIMELFKKCINEEKTRKSSLKKE